MYHEHLIIIIFSTCINGIKVVPFKIVLLILSYEPYRSYIILIWQLQLIQHIRYHQHQPCIKIQRVILH